MSRLCYRRGRIAESLSPLSGGDGAYTDPYRLYNLDVFEYEADSEMAIVRCSAILTTLRRPR